MVITTPWHRYTCSCTALAGGVQAQLATRPSGERYAHRYLSRSYVADRWTFSNWHHSARFVMPNTVSIGQVTGRSRRRENGGYISSVADSDFFTFTNFMYAL